MKTTIAKADNTSSSSKPFFNKSGTGSFFSRSQETERPFFFPSNIQSELETSQHSTKYEQEADSTIEKAIPTIGASQVSTLIQKKQEIYRKEQEILEKEDEGIETQIDRKPIFESDDDFPKNQVQTKANDLPRRSSSLESRLKSSEGKGSPLPKEHQQEMGTAFGTDFSQVKIHTDSKAIQMNQELGARAFTTSSNIFFNRGEYNPETEIGKKLLAHELTHVVQQREESGNRIMRSRNPDISHRGFDTFFIGTSDNNRAFAIQVGQRPGSSRVTLTVASHTSGLLDPAISQRRMPLSIHSGHRRSPRIIRETEIELPRRGKQKLIELELSTDANIPSLVIDLRYNRDQAYVPFPGGTFGVWRRVTVESGWIQVTDGLRELTVNFSSETPGSFHSSRFVLWRHPRLGIGYRDTQRRRFYPYPRRPSFASVELERSIVRTVIHMLPIVGPLVMVGEALVGRDIWGRRISTTERAILGAGALLSVIGPLIRAGRGAATTVRAASHVARVGNVSRFHALKMVLGARNLTAPERARLAQFAAKTRAGQALTQREVTAFNRILSKFEEPGRIASLRAEVQAITGTRTQSGRFTDLATQTSAEEVRAGQILARDLRSDVVRAPESTVSGRRVGDFLIDDVTAELYTPNTSNIENLIRGAVRKHQQSGTMVIDISQTSIPQSQILGSTGRFFGRPEFGDVSRLIFINESRVIRTVLRPSSGTSGATGAAVRGGASVIGQESSRRDQ